MTTAAPPLDELPRRVRRPSSLDRTSLQALPAKSPTNVDRQIGSRIRARREALGISQEKLAHALGITFQQVQKYEAGTNRVAASRLVVVAEALETSIGFFYEVEAPDEPLVYAVMSAPDAAEVLCAVSANVTQLRAFLSEHAGRSIQTLRRSEAARLFQRHCDRAAA